VRKVDGASTIDDVQAPSELKKLALCVGATIVVVLLKFQLIQ
jgi:hypothetical protein